MVEGARLEIWCGESHRGFESHPLRKSSPRNSPHRARQPRAPGEVSEWSKVQDWKSCVGQPTVGSNPPSPHRPEQSALMPRATVSRKPRQDRKVATVARERVLRARIFDARPDARTRLSRGIVLGPPARRQARPSRRGRTGWWPARPPPSSAWCRTKPRNAPGDRLGCRPGPRPRTAGWPPWPVPEPRARGRRQRGEPLQAGRASARVSLRTGDRYPGGGEQGVTGEHVVGLAAAADESPGDRAARVPWMQSEQLARRARPCLARPSAVSTNTSPIRPITPCSATHTSSCSRTSFMMSTHVVMVAARIARSRPPLPAIARRRLPTD